MKELQIFNNTEFGEIRVLETEGEVWFVGKEIAEVLGYKNTRDAISKHIDNEDKKTLKFRDCRATPLSNLWGQGDFTNKTLINENGLCDLILKCNTITKDKKIKLIEELKNGGYLKNIDLIPRTRKELLFINQLEDFLKEYGIKGVKQYLVLNYRIDYYIQELKLAIEYDENDHKDYSYKAHEYRQLEIEKELGCKFVRLSDSFSNARNLAKVSKYIH